MVLFLSVIFQTQGARCNAVLQHQLDLFRQNRDYLYFVDVFVKSKSTLNRLLHPAFTLETETIWKIVDVALESSHKMQEALLTESKFSAVRELVSQLETTLLAVRTIILKLIEVSNHPSSQDHNIQSSSAHNLDVAEKIFKETFRRFPEVVAPSIGYRCPLPHVFLSSKYKTFMFTMTLIPRSLQYLHALTKMFIDSGIDVNCADSSGNTLLHMVIISLPYDLKWFSPNSPYYSGDALCAATTESIADLLLQSGIYLYARNKQRQTALDLIADPELQESVANPLIALMDKYKEFPSLQHLVAITLRESNIPYQERLPELLVKFVNLH